MLIMAYMYILECCDGSFYTGSTKNLPRRLWQHQNGMGANHTAKRLPVKLVYAEEFEHVADAFYREKQVQGWSRAKKMALIQGNRDNLHVLAECQNESHYRRTDVSEMKLQDYTHFFDEIKGRIHDHQLRTMVNNVREFLSECGSAFALIDNGNQYRLEVGGQEYFIDLLLFHRRLRCLVAIELKIGDFKPEHKGKMEFYLEALDCQERMEGENPPIGMIICRSKNKTVVEYALRTAVRPIGVATYTIVPQLPDAYREELPSPEAIAERLRLWDGREVEDE
jgi:predicted GIY-YIG superfamily endonuclease